MKTIYIPLKQAYERFGIIPGDIISLLLPPSPPQSHTVQSHYCITTFQNSKLISTDNTLSIHIIFTHNQTAED